MITDHHFSLRRGRQGRQASCTRGYRHTHQFSLGWPCCCTRPTPVSSSAVEQSRREARVAPFNTHRAIEQDRSPSTVLIDPSARQLSSPRSAHSPPLFLHHHFHLYTSGGLSDDSDDHVVTARCAQTPPSPTIFNGIYHRRLIRPTLDNNNRRSRQQPASKQREARCTNNNMNEKIYSTVKMIQ